jgi:hypothetical protein
MRRTIAPLPVDHQHRHSQPTSAPKATISTINVGSGTVMIALQVVPGEIWSAPRQRVS